MLRFVIYPPNDMYDVITTCGLVLVEQGFSPCLAASAFRLLLALVQGKRIDGEVKPHSLITSAS